MPNQNIYEQSADTIRVLSVAMVENAKSGHPGGPMGGADFINVLYSDFLRFDPDDPTWFARDRFFLDPGHMSSMLYAQLALIEKYTIGDLKQFRQWGSKTPGHPELDIHRGVENTSGPLGLGHAFGVGVAIAERFLHARFGDIVEHKTYIYISDGGIQEEISQGVGRIAGHLGLHNVIMFYDANDIQLSTTTDEVSTEDVKSKYESWNWEVITIDGHNIDDIRNALQKANQQISKPTLIIGKTIIGKKAVDFQGQLYEGQVEMHGKPLGSTKASFTETIKSLGGDEHNPFVIPDNVQEHYKNVLETKKKEKQIWDNHYSAWIRSKPEKGTLLNDYLDKSLPKLDWAKVQIKENGATREASASVLSYLAEKIPNMIVSSADLSNSDKTDGFLKKTKAFQKNDFSGAFLQAGVSELTMSALSVGMSLHGGVVPACGTFFAFSDYMKPAIRLCALMEQQVIFIWTHDSFRVGEDGPTHQPVEHETQIRLLEQLKNHSHKSSMLVLRPADGRETIAAWDLALNNKHTPTGLIFSRQAINDIKTDNTINQLVSNMSKGAFAVEGNNEEADIILLANGSEVSTLIEANHILKTEHQIHSKIVSIPSIGLFDQQNKSYKDELLPPDIPKLGLTSGLPSLLQPLVGETGIVKGLEHFGYSAPYKILDKQFGFTATNIVDVVVQFLNNKS